MSEERSDTTTNNAPEGRAKRPGGVTGKGFVKGDPRINRKGRPKTFDALRRLAQQVACELVESSEGTALESRIEVIMRDWVTSGDPRKQQACVEVAYGTVPNPVEVSGKDGGPIETRQVFDHSAAIAAIARRSMQDSDSSGASEGGGDGPAVGEELHGGDVRTDGG